MLDECRCEPHASRSNRCSSCRAEARAWERPVDGPVQVQGPGVVPPAADALAGRLAPFPCVSLAEASDRVRHYARADGKCGVTYGHGLARRWWRAPSR